MTTIPTQVGDNPDNHYGVKIYPVEDFSEGPGYRVEILSNFGWPEEHVIAAKSLFQWETYDFGTDMALYTLLNKFNEAFLEDMDEETYLNNPHVWVASGSFYKETYPKTPDTWLNDVTSEAA